MHTTQSLIVITTSMSCSTNTTVRPSSRSATNVVEQRLHQRRVHARHRLVEHDELRVDHERARHLEQLALAARQRAREVVLLVGEAEVARADRARLACSRAPATATGSRERAQTRCSPRWLGAREQHVVEHGKPRQRLRQLERPHHARPRDAVGGPARELRCRRSCQCPPSARSNPVSRLNSVVLPAPFGPIERGDRVALHLEVVDVDGEQSAERAPHAARPRGSGRASRHPVRERSPSD